METEKRFPSEKPFFGVLMRYNKEKGFGFIRLYKRIPEDVLENSFNNNSTTQEVSSYNTLYLEAQRHTDVSDIFVHVTDSKEDLIVGQWLFFRIESDKKKIDRYKASKVHSLKEEVLCWIRGESIPPAILMPVLLDLWLAEKIPFFTHSGYYSLVITLKPTEQINFVRKIISEKKIQKNTIVDLFQKLIRFNIEDVSNIRLVSF